MIMPGRRARISCRNLLAPSLSSWADTLSDDVVGLRTRSVNPIPAANAASSTCCPDVGAGSTPTSTSRDIAHRPIRPW